VFEVATAERVALNEELYRRREVLISLDLTDEPELDAETVEKLFMQRVIPLTWKKQDTVVYGRLAEQGADHVDAYAFPISGRGFWGPIYGYLGVSPDGNTLVGIGFLKHLETPGLGARIEELWFGEQFEGKDISQPKDGISIKFVPEGASLDDHSVHAITGATRTSQGLESFLNRDIKRIKAALSNGELTRADAAE